MTGKNSPPDGVRHPAPPGSLSAPPPPGEIPGPVAAENGRIPNLLVTSDDKERKEIILAEYNVLHAQILGIQSRRDNLATITVTVNATIYGLFFTLISSERYPSMDKQLVLAAFTFLTYMFIVPSIIMMRSHQQHMRRIVNYIANNIESRLEDLNWSSRRHNNKSSSPNGLRGMGNLYMFLCVTPLLHSLVIMPGKLVLTLLVVLLLYSLAEAADIRWAYRKSWRSL
jgi:hypothetical protein